MAPAQTDRERARKRDRWQIRAAQSRERKLQLYPGSIGPIYWRDITRLEAIRAQLRGDPIRTPAALARAMLATYRKAMAAQVRAAGGDLAAVLAPMAGKDQDQDQDRRPPSRRAHPRVDG
jgi:hypothetical protein